MAATREDGRSRLTRLTRALLLSPVVLLVASATRLLIVCDYDAQAAATVAATGGLTGTLLGTTIPLLPALLPALVLFLLVARRWVLASVMAAMTAVISPAYSTFGDAWDNARVFAPQLWRWPLDWLSKDEGPALDAVGLMPTDAWCAFVVASLAAVVAIWSPPGWTMPPAPSARSEPTDRRVLRRISRLLVYPAVMFFITGFATLLFRELYRVPTDWSTLSGILRRPWLPAEEIEPKTGTHLVGYTIGTKDGWHVILREYDRSIEHIPTASVTDRQVCALQGLQDLQKLPVIRMDGVWRHSLPRCREETVPSSS